MSMEWDGVELSENRDGRDSLGPRSPCKKKVNPISTTLVLFGKYCPIVDQLGSKDSSRDFQLNCVISYFFYLHLILHTNG